ncbi:MAG: hypothetical protein HQM09_02295 [Candidatus Riflebacteria bacterium]|nr:hypothetical protein [Candidatus Riflebacteria bacterium]
MVQDASREALIAEPFIGCSTGDVLKRRLLCDRLRLSESEVNALLDSLHREGSSILGLRPEHVTFDVEFSGRELDLLFTFPGLGTATAGKKS